MVFSPGRRFRQGLFTGLYRPRVKGISHRRNPPRDFPLLPTQQLRDRFDQTVNVVTGGFDIHFEARLSHRF
jgi:hypothetical protein